MMASGMSGANRFFLGLVLFLLALWALAKLYTLLLWVFLAFTLYLFENWDEEQALGFPFSRYPTLGAIYRLSSGDGTDLKKFLQKQHQLFNDLILV